MRVCVKDIATIQLGYSFRVRIENESAGTVSVIQMKDLNDDGTVDVANLARVHLDIKKHHTVQHNDIIVRSRGVTTTAAMLTEEMENAIVAAPLIRIRVSTAKVLPEYLLWYINHPETQRSLQSQATGTAQRMLGKEAVEDLEIEIPDMARQKAIVELATLVGHEKELLGSLIEKRRKHMNQLLIKAAKGG